MIEIWTCNGSVGTVGEAVHPFVSANLALAQAYHDRTLTMDDGLRPGTSYDLTPYGDDSPQRLFVYDDGTCEMSEVTHGPVQGVYATRRVVVGPDDEPCVLVRRTDETPTDAGFHARLFWLICSRESTPWLQGMRDLLRPRQ